MAALSLAGSSREAAKPVVKSDRESSRKNTTINGPSGPGWSIVTAPAFINYPNGVTCSSNISCWAVGSGGPPSIEHWNGNAWVGVPSPNVGTNQAALVAVSCISDSDCWAAGNSNAGSYRQTLIEHWDGTSWSVATSPSLPLQDNILEGVTCTSNSDCWAVGYYSSHRTLVEHWDGTSWTIVPSPNGSGTSHYLLSAVTCTSSSDCFAVGYYSNGSFAQTLVEHWDGVLWSIIASPNTSVGQNNYFLSIKCTLASQCFAVGFYAVGNVYQTLIEQWNGSTWSVSSSSNSAATQNNVLYSVDCLSASDCWSVGFHDTGSPASAYVGMTMHWDGSLWSIIPSPEVTASFLSGVACIGGLQCWAVGTYRMNVNGGSQPLIEEYSPTTPALIGVASRMTHGTAGTFDINLPVTGSPGIECRTSNALGAGNYSVVFNFVNNITNCGTAAAAGGTIVAGPSANQCTMNLTGVADAQTISVELDNVIDSQNNTGNVSIPMGVLIGDSNGDGLVNVGDTVPVRNHSGETATLANFRQDLNADGLINVGDTLQVRNHSGDFLP